ncbi:hypothetical protein COU60_03375 [Candidatus Pacearchaeota archaeon CG10_big_fil_rev_8_21_14_0_10_34_76]|nr:MAG: hypothetical protein COU60_03375 [Candidatus Pacearchaeota archaeon CG10_big_fil_rev_8_21_14_0_10_34_76]
MTLTTVGEVRREFGGILPPNLRYLDSHVGTESAIGEDLGVACLRKQIDYSLNVRDTYLVRLRNPPANPEEAVGLRTAARDYGIAV